MSRISLEQESHSRRFLQLLRVKFLGQDVLSAEQSIEILTSLFDILLTYPHLIDTLVLNATLNEYEKSSTEVQQTLLHGWCKLFYTHSECKHVPCLQIIITTYLNIEESTSTKEMCRVFLQE